MSNNTDGNAQLHQRCMGVLSHMSNFFFFFLFFFFGLWIIFFQFPKEAVTCRSRRSDSLFALTCLHSFTRQHVLKGKQVWGTLNSQYYLIYYLTLLPTLLYSLQLNTLISNIAISVESTANNQYSHSGKCSSPLHQTFTCVSSHSLSTCWPQSCPTLTAPTKYRSSFITSHSWHASFGIK